MKIFTGPSGNLQPNPPSKEIAISLRKKKYDDNVTCLKCGSCSIKYTATDRCVYCSHLYAAAFWQMAVFGEDTMIYTEGDMERVEYCDNFKRSQSTLVPATLLKEWIDDYHAARPYDENKDARTNGAMGKPYLTHMACTTCGGIGIRTGEGKCWHCEQGVIARREAREQREKEKRERALRLSPRQRAMQAGETWYTPDTPCKRCGTTALRRVSDGRCQGCFPLQGRRRAPQDEVMEKYPDMVISQDDARALGLRYFRTGRACRYGHMGWRYVSTGGCVDCRQSGTHAGQ